jgi:D-3-phosphoglycerate dehydrogenase / 2-oxoglutarate reductase
MAAGTFPDASVEQEHLRGQDVTVHLTSLTETDEVERVTADADGVIITTNSMPRSLIERLGRGVRIIGRAGIGLDAIDMSAAADRGLAVLHCPDYCTVEVAEHAVAMIFAINRRIVRADNLARHNWASWRELTPLKTLSQQSIGVVGCGRIGMAVIDRLRPSAREILTFDPWSTNAPAGIKSVGSMAELLRASDLVTLHIPLTPETREMINGAALAQMRPGAVLINVSRGGLVDEKALCAALESGRIAGAALDVLADEPPSRDNPLLRMSNVLLTPHFAWYSTDAERRARTMTVDGMIDYLEGREPTQGRLALRPTGG